MDNLIENKNWKLLWNTFQQCHKVSGGGGGTFVIRYLSRHFFFSFIWPTTHNSGFWEKIKSTTQWNHWSDYYFDRVMIFFYHHYWRKRISNDEKLFHFLACHQTSFVIIFFSFFATNIYRLNMDGEIYISLIWFVLFGRHETNKQHS